MSTVLDEQRCDKCGQWIVDVDPLRDKELEVLQYLVDYKAEHGVAPYLKEISDHMGWTRKSGAASKYLKRLEKKGWIERTPDTPRAVKILVHPEVRGNSQNRSDG